MTRSIMVVVEARKLFVEVIDEDGNKSVFGFESIDDALDFRDALQAEDEDHSPIYVKGE